MAIFLLGDVIGGACISDKKTAVVNEMTAFIPLTSSRRIQPTIVASDNNVCPKILIKILKLVPYDVSKYETRYKYPDLLTNSF